MAKETKKEEGDDINSTSGTSSSEKFNTYDRQDSKFIELFKEVEEYSITPKTFQIRSILAQLGDDFTWYIDKFSNGKKSVERFGINAAKVEHKNLQSKIIDEKAADLKSIGSAKELEKKATQVKHEGIEKLVVIKAMDSLLSGPQQTVLVDVFVRDNQGSLVEKNKLLEVHTVVLYRNPLNKISGLTDITIIDPSNFYFSSHIMDMKIGILPGLGKVIGFNANSVIYNKRGSDDPGPGPDKYRDCIDIAAKLAFALDETKEQKQIDTLEKATSLDAVKLIANTRLDPNFVPEWGTARVKQSSDMQVVREFAKKEGEIQVKLQKITKILGLTVVTKAKQKGAEPIKNLYDPQKSLMSMQHELNAYISKLDDHIELKGLCEEVIKDNF